MAEPITLAKPIGTRTRAGKVMDKLHDASYRLKLAMYYGAATMTMTTAPTLCAGSMDDLVGELVGFIFTLARIVGIVLAANGTFNWILANKDENADGQARGIKLVICGLALVFLKELASPILKAAGFTI